MTIEILHDPAVAEGRDPLATDTVSVYRGDIDPSLGGYGPDPEDVKIMQKVMYYTPVDKRASSYAYSVKLSEPAKDCLDCLGSAAVFRESSKKIRGYFTWAQSNRLDEYEYGSRGGYMFSIWRETAVASCLLYGGTEGHVDAFVPPSILAQVDDQDRTKVLRSMADKLGKQHLENLIDAVSKGKPTQPTAYAVAFTAGNALSHALSEHWALGQVDRWTHGIPEGLEPNDMQKSLFELRRRVPADFDPAGAVPNGECLRDDGIRRGACPDPKTSSRL